jgi:signal transduction histidine kinase
VADHRGGGSGAPVPITVESYAAHPRGDRVIAVARMIVAISAWLLGAFTWGGTTAWAPLSWLQAGYTAYAGVVLLLVWQTSISLLRLRLVSHVVDVAAFAVLYLSESHVAGAFFVFFVFSLLSATLRWQWRGTLAMATIVLAMALAMGIHQTVNAEDFLANRSMIRGVYLAVLSSLVGYFLMYELNLRRDLSKIAAGQRNPPADFDDLLRDILRDAADVLGAPRTVMVWNETAGDLWHLAAWSSSEFSVVSESTPFYDPIVVAPLTDADFHCQDAAVRGATVMVRDGRRSRRVKAAPAHPAFLARFGAISVLSVRLHASGSVTGRLFWLDKTKIAADDVMLGRLVAQGVAAHLQYMQLLEERKRAARAEERVQLARDLHDGVLQSLMAISLKVEGARSAANEGPTAVDKHLGAVQGLVRAEQRYLRQFIGLLKPGGALTRQSLGARLQLLSERVGLEWSVAVDWHWLDGREPVIPAILADQVYYIVSEALVNAARHSGATQIEAELGVRDGAVVIVVTDNGRGFPFRGRFDDAALSAAGQGPRVLSERVYGLSGRLSVESSERGARIEVVVPLRDERVTDAY